MAFIDGKGLVGQAKVFATEREAELDSQLAAANETIKRLRATIAASDVIRASDTRAAESPKEGTA